MLRLIAELSWLREAAEITLSSKGSNTPGVDGIIKDVMQHRLNGELEEIRRKLLDGTYQPAPARRVYIPKANGKLRPLGIPTLRDRIVQRAMTMAMEPVWESDFHPRSCGFRPARSVHHAIRTLRLQLTDNTATYNRRAGRWVIEGDLSSYFDTVHHRLLMKAVRRRIRDRRFLKLLWKFIKAGHVDKGLFCAASEGVPQGGVISPLLSNIMLNEFDHWMERNYLDRKQRNIVEKWNKSVRQQAPIAQRQQRQEKPTYSYCRYADDFVIVVRGTRRHAEEFREICREYLEGTLKLKLNMEKTLITHVNDGFVFLGHRVIRKRGGRGIMRPITTIPQAKYRSFVEGIIGYLEKNPHGNPIDIFMKLNQKLTGWAHFYEYTDFVAGTYRRVDSAVFWKVAEWLSRKYRCKIKKLLIRHCGRQAEGKARNWMWEGLDSQGNYQKVYLRRIAGSKKGYFKGRVPKENPYIGPEEKSLQTRTAYRDVAFAMSD